MSAQGEEMLWEERQGVLLFRKESGKEKGMVSATSDGAFAALAVGGSLAVLEEGGGGGGLKGRRVAEVVCESVESMVWGAHAKVLGVVTDDGRGVAVARAGGIVAEACGCREREGGGLLSFMIGGKGGSTKDRVVTFVPLDESENLVLLSVWESGKLFVETSTRTQRVGVEGLLPERIYAAAATATSLIIMQRGEGNAAIFTAFQLIQHEPFLELIGTTVLKDSDIGLRSPVLAALSSCGSKCAFYGGGTLHLISIVSERYVRRRSIAAQGKGEEGTGEHVTYITGQSIIPLDSAQVSSLCFWTSQTIVLALQNGMLMGVSADSKMQAVQSPHKTGTSPGVVVAAGKGRQLLLLTPVVSSSSSTDACDWSLNIRIIRTVQEMFSHYLERENWATAVDFATAHGLDVDNVHLARWATLTSADTIITAEALDDTLGRMSNAERAASLCAVTIAETPEEQLDILGFGIRVAAQHYAQFFNQGTENMLPNTTNEAVEALGLRIRLLRQRERIGTLLELSHGVWDREAYGDIRDKSIEAVASDLAMHSHVAGLQVVMERHGAALLGQELSILSKLPLLISGDLVLSLLPNSGETLLPKPSLPPDWSEGPQALHFMVTNGQSWIGNATEWLSRSSDGRTHRVYEDKTLATWVISRAQEIEASTSRIDLAKRLIDSARQLGIHARSPESSCIVDDMDDLYSLVYDAGHWDMTLTDYQSMSEYSKFLLLMTECERSTDEKNDSVSSSRRRSLRALHSRAIPYMHRCMSRHSSTDKEESTFDSSNDIQSLVEPQFTHNVASDYLCRALLDAVADNPVWCAEVLEYAKTEFDTVQQGSDSCLFSSADDMAKAALTCLYHTPGAHTDCMVRFVRSIPTILISSSILAHVQIARAHADSAFVLKSYGIDIMPIEFFKANDDDPVSLLRRLLAHCIRLKVNDADGWMKVWNDIDGLSAESGPFFSIDETTMKVELVRAILRAGKPVLALPYLAADGTSDDAGFLPALETEKILVTVAREYSASATTLVCDDTRLARECLSLAPWSESARRELDALDALMLASEMGLELVPYKLRKIADPVMVVELLVKECPEVWRQPTRILEFATLLGAHSIEAQAAVRLLIAGAAYEHKDYEEAATTVLELTSAGYEPSWALARDLSCCASSIPSEQKIKLASFALLHCPDTDLSFLLQTWNKVDSDICRETAEESLGIGGLSIEDTSRAIEEAISQRGDQKEVVAAIACLVAAILRGMAWEESVHSSFPVFLGESLARLSEDSSGSLHLQLLSFVAGSLLSDTNAHAAERAMHNAMEAFTSSSTSDGAPGTNDIIALRLRYHAYRAYLFLYTTRVDKSKPVLPDLSLHPKALISGLKSFIAECGNDQGAILALEELSRAELAEEEATTSSDVAWIGSHIPGGVAEEQFLQNVDYRNASFAAAAMTVACSKEDSSNLMNLAKRFDVEQWRLTLPRYESVLYSSMEDSDILLLCNELLPDVMECPSNVISLLQERALLHWGESGPPPFRLRLIYEHLSDAYGRVHPEKHTNAVVYRLCAQVVEQYKEDLNLFELLTDMTRVMLPHDGSGLDSGSSRSHILLKTICNVLFLDTFDIIDDVLSKFRDAMETAASFLPTKDAIALCLVYKVAYDTLGKTATNTQEDKLAAASMHLYDSIRGLFQYLRESDIPNIAEFLCLSGRMPESIENALSPDGNSGETEFRLPQPSLTLSIGVLSDLRDVCQAETSIVQLLDSCLLSLKFLDISLRQGARKAAPVVTSLAELSQVSNEVQGMLTLHVSEGKPFSDLCSFVKDMVDNGIVEGLECNVKHAYEEILSSSIQKLSVGSGTDVMNIQELRNMLESLSEPQEVEFAEFLDEIRGFVWGGLRDSASFLDEDLNFVVIKELSSMVDARAHNGEIPWGAWRAPVGDSNKKEMLLHATLECLSPRDLAFTLEDIETMESATESFCGKVRHAQSSLDLNALEKVTLLWKSEFTNSEEGEAEAASDTKASDSKKDTTSFRVCWTDMIRRYNELGLVFETLRLLDSGRFDINEEKDLWESSLVAMEKNSSEQVSMVAALLAPKWNVAMDLDSNLKDKLCSRDSDVPLTSDMIILILQRRFLGDICEGRDFREFVGRVNKLFTQLLMSAKQEDTTLLSVIMPVFLAELILTKHVLVAANFTLEITACNPAMRTTEAGIFILQRMLKAYSSSHIIECAGCSQVPASAALLSESISKRCKEALRILNKFVS